MWIFFSFLVKKFEIFLQSTYFDVDMVMNFSLNCKYLLDSIGMHNELDFVVSCLLLACLNAVHCSCNDNLRIRIELFSWATCINEFGT